MSAPLELSSQLRETMLAWRKTLHGTAEVGFLEQVTAAFVAQKLSEFGITVVSGVGGTGVVGTLSCGESLQSIGLRAELDAVPKSGLVAVTRSASQASATHACGHDGHMAMLLGAAKHLSQTKRFDGTIRFIFQPAEESGTGAGAMIQDGLFTRFPVDALFGLHNVPYIPAGKFGIGVGPVMATVDRFTIVIRGRAGHDATPRANINPIIAASHLVQALQTTTLRILNPTDVATVTVTQFVAADDWNTVPQVANIGGVIRSLHGRTQKRLLDEVARVAKASAILFECTADIESGLHYSPTINDPEETQFAIRAATAVAGPEGLLRQLPPIMSGEDFGTFLERKPGCYALLGTGEPGAEAGLHSAGFEFNDAVLAAGANFWVELVEHRLSMAGTISASKTSCAKDIVDPTGPSRSHTGYSIFMNFGLTPEQKMICHAVGVITRSLDSSYRLQLACGLSVGCTDTDVPENQLRTDKLPVDAFVKFLRD
jgi:hippurate hydrolase